MQGSAIQKSHETNHVHHDHRLFGLVLFLIAESSIFLGLFSAFLVYKTVMPIWPPTGTPELELLLPGINTIILISSSLLCIKDRLLSRKTMFPD